MEVRSDLGYATHASVHMDPEELGRHELERGDGMEVGSDLGCATHASVHMDPEGLGRHDRGWGEGGRVGRSVVHCPPRHHHCHRDHHHLLLNLTSWCGSQVVVIVIRVDGGWVGLVREVV